MSSPMPALSPSAKSKIAAGAAVILSGITAWQTATRAGFTWLDIVPVVAVVAGAIATDLVPNTPGQPVAKAIVHGALSAVAAAASAVAAFAASDPSGVTAIKLVTIAAASVMVWYVPEAAPAVKVVEADVTSGAPAAQVLATVAGDVSRLMGPDLPATPGALVVQPAAPAVPTA